MKKQISNIENFKISEAFISENINEIRSIAKKIFYQRKIPSSVDLEDLVNWGIEGLIDAKMKYKKSGLAQFKTYSYYRIKGHILDQLRLEWKYKNPQEYESYKKNIQLKMLEATELIIEEKSKDYQRNHFEKTLKSIIEQSSLAFMLSENSKQTVCEQEINENPEEKILKEENNIWDAVNNISEEHAVVIKLMYLENLKQTEISEKLKLSKSKVCRLHNRAIELLKKELVN